MFLRFGGHRQAAGVTLEAARLRRAAPAAHGAGPTSTLGPDDLVPRLRIDAPLGLREISGDVIEGLARLGPFGAANPKPVFRASPVDLMEAAAQAEGAAPGVAVQAGRPAFRAIAWRAAEREAYLTTNRFGLELAYSLEQGEYRGEKVTELTVADVRVPAVVAP